MSTLAAAHPASHKTLRVLGWSMVALAGAFSIGVLALSRGEPVNALWMVVAAICIFAIGYRFHSAWLMAMLTLDDLRATPAEVHADGRDFVKTNKWVVFGHHFAAIAGPDPWSARCWLRSLATCRACSGCWWVPRWAARCTIR